MRHQWDTVPFSLALFWQRFCCCCCYIFFLNIFSLRWDILWRDERLHTHHIVLFKKLNFKWICKNSLHLLPMAVRAYIWRGFLALLMSSSCLHLFTFYRVASSASRVMMCFFNVPFFTFFAGTSHTCDWLIFLHFFWYYCCCCCCCCHFVHWINISSNQLKNSHPFADHKMSKRKNTSTNYSAIRRQFILKKSMNMEIMSRKGNKKQQKRVETIKRKRMRIKRINVQTKISTICFSFANIYFSYFLSTFLMKMTTIAKTYILVMDMQNRITPIMSVMEFCFDVFFCDIRKTKHQNR